MLATRRKLPVILFCAGVLLASDFARSAPRASRTRPSGSSSGGAAAPRATAPRGSAPSRASGTARYGYGYGRYSYDYGHPYGYWGYGYGHPWWWGWPYGYYGVSVWGPYRAYPLPRDARNAPAAVEIDVRPKKAAVRLDGEEIGQARDYNGTWDYLWLRPGEYVLEFERPGYMILRVDLDVGAGEYQRLKLRLHEGEGLDPRSSPERERAAPNTDTAIRPSTRIDTPRPVERPRHLATAVRKGFLRFRVEPRDAAVYLDGEFLATAGELSRLHGALPVAVGEHVVEAVRPGMQSRSVVVHVGEGEAAIATIRLGRAGAGDVEPGERREE